NRAADFLHQGDAFIGGEQRRFSGVHADRQHQLVGEPAGAANNVEVAVGDRIEGTGVEGGARHGEGLAGYLLGDKRAFLSVIAAATRAAFEGAIRPSGSAAPSSRPMRVE